MQAIGRLPLSRLLPQRVKPVSAKRHASLPSALVEEARLTRIRGRFPTLIWDDVPRQLSSASRTYLRDALVPLAQQVFDCTSVRFWLDWLSDRNLDQLKRLILVYNEEGELIGWAASSQFVVNGRRCFYGSSAGVHPAYQGQGITSATARRLFLPALFSAAPYPLYAVVRTANPMVYSAWRSGSAGRKAVFPTPAGGALPPWVCDIAAATAERLGQAGSLEADTLIMRDAYREETDGLWSARPGCDQDDVCRWFDAALGPRDAVMMVVPFHPAAMFTKELKREIRRRTGRRMTDSSRRPAAGATDRAA